MQSPSLPWWVMIFVQIFLLFFAGLLNGAIELHPVEETTCQIHIKVHEARVLADMGDGLFDGKMELQLVIAVGNSDTFLQHQYPTHGSRKLSQGDTVRLSDFSYVLDGTDEVWLYILAIEVDELVRIGGVDIGQAATIVGNTMREYTGFVGDAIDTAIEGSVGIMNTVFATDDIITEDTLVLRREDNWSAGRYQTYRTRDNDLEINYSILLSGCQ